MNVVMVVHGPGPGRIRSALLLALLAEVLIFNMLELKLLLEYVTFQLVF